MIVSLVSLVTSLYVLIKEIYAQKKQTEIMEKCILALSRIDDYRLVNSLRQNKTDDIDTKNNS